MKRSIFSLVLVLSFLMLPSAELSAQETDSMIAPLASLQDKVQAQKELSAAIRQRQIRYLLELKRGHSNRNTGLLQHRYNLYRNNVNTTSTELDRTGAMTSYDGRRAFSNPTTAAPNNAKRNFRTRALDYYVYAGDAGREALLANVVLGSEHQVTRNYLNKITSQAGYADIVSRIRTLQRERAASNADAPYNPYTSYYGASERNYLHPYMRAVE